MQERFSRFKDALWFPKGEEINVIVGGAGGIGSWLTLLLTRAGFAPIVYDFDVYETHNMAGQLCKKTDAGKLKVEALKDTIKDFCDHTIIALNERYDATKMTDRFVFSGFDNMEARKIMFGKWEKAFGQDPNAIFIDGRLTLEQIQIFCVVGGTKGVETFRKEHLFDDSVVQEAACTLKQTSHTAAMIASHMVGFFTNHYTHVNSGQISRVVPFKWEYLVPIDYLSTEY